MTDVNAIVEAAAMAIAGDEWPADGVEVDERGNDYADLSREPYRQQARAALAAALPGLVEALGATIVPCCGACSAQWHRADLDRRAAALAKEIRNAG